MQPEEVQSKLTCVKILSLLLDPPSLPFRSPLPPSLHPPPTCRQSSNLLPPPHPPPRPTTTRNPTQSVTEDTWDEVQTGSISEYGGGDRYSQIGTGRPYSAQSQTQYGAVPQQQQQQQQYPQQYQQATYGQPMTSSYPYQDGPGR